MRLAEPAWLFLVVLAVVPYYWERTRPRLRWPTLARFVRAPRGWVVRGRSFPVLLKGLALVGMAVALARPQTVAGRTLIAGKGVAIMLVLDRSTSMEAEDPVPPINDPRPGAVRSRLDHARTAIERFITGRPEDLIGLVAFANYPDLICPLTLDHAFLIDAVNALKPARPGDDGTNIGDAIAWALDALRSAKPPEKVLVLLTDGDNAPAVPRPLDPRAAADLARKLGVVLHTIALGRPGGIVREREPITGLTIPQEVPGPNVALLQNLARRGGGRMFSATDPGGLEAVFREINRLETSPVQGTIRTRYHEWYPIPIAAAMVLLVLDRVVSAGRLRRLP